ncbi:unnamed protein product, partial [Urochloa humidicola]
AVPPKAAPPSSPLGVLAPVPYPPPRPRLLHLHLGPAAPFSLEEYLVAACGLAPDQARKTAQKAFDGASRESRKAFKEISNCRLNSASNPDAVLKLLSGVGLSRDDIQFL